MQLIQLNCPQCGASLEVEASLKYCFCLYCGAKAILDDGSVTTHIIDEAKIREAEANERIKLRQAEVELQRIKAETAALEKIRLEQTQASLELERQKIAAQKDNEETKTVIRMMTIFIIGLFVLIALIFLGTMFL